MAEGYSAKKDHLTISNLRKVRKACWEARACWMDIGIELRLSKTDLDAIKTSVGDDPRKCFTEMLSLWLKQVDPLPTQRALVEALRNPAVNLGQLAERVEKEDLLNDLNSSDQVVTPRAVVVPHEADNQLFPHINDIQDEQSRRELEQRLKVESEEIRLQFCVLMNKYFNSLEDQKYSISRLIRYLKTGLETDCLLPDPKVIDDIMKLIESKSSFFNYQLIEYMIKLSGTDDDRQNLENYQTKFSDYAKRRVYECPAIISKSNPSETELHVKLDSKYDKYTVAELTDFQSRLCRILNRKVYAIRLLSVQRGCFKLIYAISDYIVKATFPLTEKQESELAALGVLHLNCNDYWLKCTTSQVQASSKYSDAFGSSLESSTSSQLSHRLPVALRKPHQPPKRNGTSSTSSSISPLPPISPVPAVTRHRPVMEQQMSDSFSSQEGFGICLQQCYEAITKKHEDELLALESLRGHIFNRARADKEYAESLNRMNQKANKKVQNINQSSAVVQAWLCFLEMSDNLQKQISCGAAQMSTVILNAVDQLIRDKRGAKSVFDQEQARLESEKKLSCTTVHDLCRNYRKHLTATEGYKGKLKTALARDPPKPAEQDKYRKKFVLHAERLHSCHNNYSLAVLNANVHQDYFQASLLPFTLDTLQYRMELNISQWKDAMMNYAKALDLTQTYQDSFQKFYNSLRCVEQEQEYVEFIRENKKDQIPVEHYEFDPVLLQSHAAPKVEAGKVVINNLTHNGIKTRLAALENDLEQHAKDIKQKEQDLKDLVNSPDDMDSLSSPLPPSSPSKEPAQLPKHVRISHLQSQIKELVCLQARKHVQADLIKEAVDGMYEATPPLFDPLGEGVDVSNIVTSASSGTTGTTGTSATLKGGYKAKHAIGTLKHGLKGLFKADRSKSISSSKHDSDSGGLTPVISQDMLDTYTADADSDTSSLGEYNMPPEIPVEEEEWYFGDIDRRLAESKCKKQGDYLVRYSERQNKYILTCSWNGNSKHFIIQQVPNEKGEIQYRFESRIHATIKALLDYHVESGMPVTRQSGAKIATFVTKYDKWALNHSDITIGRKIGKGAFGDVFEASLKSTGERLAIKSCRSSDFTDMDKFLQEAEILKQYDHPNVVKLIGVCAEKDPVYIVMEFMPGGAFLDFLRKKGCNQTKKKLCGMCINACQGMAYLESMHCIHRDLAARNCLVGDGDIVKISDFGMSREDEGGIYIASSGTRQIPIKWTAPEALNYGKYTTSSDVWSFGILLWEAFSCGSAPYPGMSNHDARSQIEVGYHMPAPAECPMEVYGVMQQCWQYDPEERPDFSTILNMLQQAEQRVKT